MDQVHGSTRALQEVAGCENLSRDVDSSLEKPGEAGGASASARAGGESTCPHLDRDDARCAHRLSLGRIDQAFSVCFSAFHACPVFQRISAEPPQPAREQRFVEIRVVARAGLRRLRPTGS